MPGLLPDGDLRGAAATLAKSFDATDPLYPELNLDLALGDDPTGQIDPDVDWEFTLTFGVTEMEFFVVTSNANELRINVDLQLKEDFSGQGKVGSTSTGTTGRLLSTSGSPMTKATMRFPAQPSR